MWSQEYIDRGDLVPDDVTVPMVLDTLRARGPGPYLWWRVRGGGGVCWGTRLTLILYVVFF